MIDLCQEMGRGGRDGDYAECLTIYWRGIMAETDWIKGDDRADVMMWIESEGCMRRGIGEYLYGRGVDCLSLKGAAICDRCEAAYKDERRDEVMEGNGGRRGSGALLEAREVRESRELREMVDEVIGRCMPCFFAGREDAVHELHKCKYMVRRCLFRQSEQHSARDCIKERFQRGSCCWTCGLPQKAYGKEIHGDVRTGECKAGLRDVVRGGCWSLYRSERWLRRWFESRRLEWKGEEEFRDWIAELEEEGEVINGVRIILEAWRDKAYMN
jgi:hypothetical protein